jgi:hypothetical protein
MSKDTLSHYEQISISFADWIAINGNVRDPKTGCWYDKKGEGIAKNTSELLLIFQTQ